MVSIIHIIDTLQTGGAEGHLATMLGGLVQEAHLDNRVVTLFNDGPPGDSIRALGVPVDQVPIGPLLERRRFVTAGNILVDYFSFHQPDIVEAHLTFSRLFGLYAAWRAGVPRRIAFEKGDIYLNSTKFRVANFLGQFFAQRIVVPSMALGEWNHRTHGIARHRLEVLPNCVDTERFRPSQDARLHPPFDRPDGSTLFCAVGMLGNGVTKRMDICLHALALARAHGADVCLVICGDGPLRRGLEELATSLGIAGNVRFLGTRTDMPRIMAACDVFCHATPWEPFGIVALEALATGLPAIVPDSGGIREIVEDGVTGLFYPPLDAHALAAAMTWLHHDPALAKSMGKAGRQVMQTRYSVTQYVRRLHELYGFEQTQAPVMALP